MARLLHMDESGRATEVGDLSSCFEFADGWRWLELTVDDRDLISVCADRQGWDGVELEDVLEDAPVGKVIDAGDHIFAVFHSVRIGEGRITSSEVDAFLDGRMLVTVRHSDVPELDEVWGMALRPNGPVEGGPDRMMARLAAAMATAVLPLLDILEDRIEAVEEAAMTRDQQVIGAVQVLRSDVTRLRRFVAPQREVMLTLSRDISSPLLGHRARRRLADVHEHLTRVLEALEGARLLLGSALETYRSAVAEETNRTMKVLTIFSAMLLPLTVMAGVWGMNFRNMPELATRYGYFIALGSMLLVAVLTWGFFARQGFVRGLALHRLPRAIGLGLWEVAALPLKVAEHLVEPVRNVTDTDVD